MVSCTYLHSCPSPWLQGRGYYILGHNLDKRWRCQNIDIFLWHNFCMSPDHPLSRKFTFFKEKRFLFKLYELEDFFYWPFIQFRFLDFSCDIFISTILYLLKDFVQDEAPHCKESAILSSLSVEEGYIHSLGENYDLTPQSIIF